MPDAHDLLWAALLIGQTAVFYLLSRLRERAHKIVLAQMQNNLEMLQLITRVSELMDEKDAQA